MTRQQLAERVRVAWLDFQTTAIAFAHGAATATEVVNRRNRLDALRTLYTRQTGEAAVY